MPLLRSIEKTADGFRLVKSNGGVLSIASADIPSDVKAQGIASAQTWVISWLANNGYNAICQIKTLTPLDIVLVIGQNVPAGFFTMAASMKAAN